MKAKEAKQLNAHQALQQMLMRMMGLTDADMYRLIYSYGMEYLQDQCSNDTEGIMALEQQAFYWNWWKNNWCQRDAEFVALHGLENGEDTERAYEFSVNEKGELMTMTLYGAYRLYHLQAMADENLCKSYCHIITATQHIWRKRIFTNQTT